MTAQAPQTADSHFVIVWHSRTGAARALAEAVWSGAEGVSRLIAASDVVADDLIHAMGYVFVCPENLGSMTGAMKEMFDRCYYPLLDRVEGLPYATIITAGSDGTGAHRQIDRIVTGWRLRRMAEPMIVNFDAQDADAILAPKHVQPADRHAALELGAGFAEGLRMGIF